MPPLCLDILELLGASLCSYENPVVIPAQRLNDFLVKYRGFFRKHRHILCPAEKNPLRSHRDVLRFVNKLLRRSRGIHIDTIKGGHMVRKTHKRANTSSDPDISLKPTKGKLYRCIHKAINKRRSVPLSILYENPDNIPQPSLSIKLPIEWPDDIAKPVPASGGPGVYFVYVKEISYQHKFYLCKIGKTKNHSQRRDQLQIANAFNVYVRAFLPCQTNATAYQVEELFHQVFKRNERHIRGEWYWVSEADIRYLCRLFSWFQHFAWQKPRYSLVLIKDDEADDHVSESEMF